MYVRFIVKGPVPLQLIHTQSLTGIVHFISFYVLYFILNFFFNLFIHLFYLLFLGQEKRDFILLFWSICINIFLFFLN